MQKLKQYSLVLACVVSLFASSFAACVCSSHHEEQANVEASSSHHHAEGHEHSEHIEKTDSADESVTRMVSEHDCSCFSSATLKTGAKSETVKLNAQLAALPERVVPETIVFVPKEIPVKFNFSKPLYLSDSFYNLAPGRAPPAL